eukprot:NODE_940_length_2909_cov_0.513167.p2 type:complete len:226 gc:universal NODE_940_length_2909_cov_0.513167:2132-1455(-)
MSQMERHNEIVQAKPWQNDVHYFKRVSISSLALMKMAVHAESGNEIEVMGLILGFCRENEFVVKDVFRAPVDGTETRVNAGNDAVEYMVNYCEDIEDMLMIGWYHSHPGYGCWLSGIDVETQKLNQDFHHTWVALVIDPFKTKVQQKVEIGAFRTYPNDYTNDRQMHLNVRMDKVEDFGVHMNKYYALDIRLECEPLDKQVFDVISNYNWSSILSTQFVIFIDLG